jgi:DNA-binding MarR family transcriptional regulator
VTARGDPVDKLQLERLSLFRYELRRFLRFSEDVARESDVTVRQYLLMLHSQGFPGRDWASVGELAQRLQTQPHAAVMLVTRCEQMGLVERRANADDARVVEVHLTRKGRQCLQQIALKLELELAKLAAVITRAKAGVSGAGEPAGVRDLAGPGMRSLKAARKTSLRPAST